MSSSCLAWLALSKHCMDECYIVMLKALRDRLTLCGVFEVRGEDAVFACDEFIADLLEQLTGGERPFTQGSCLVLSCFQKTHINIAVLHIFIMCWLSAAHSPKTRTQNSLPLILEVQMMTTYVGRGCWLGFSQREPSDSESPSPKELWVTTTWTVPPEMLASSRANQGSWEGEMAVPPGPHSMALSMNCSNSSLMGILSESVTGNETNIKYK